MQDAEQTHDNEQQQKQHEGTVAAGTGAGPVEADADWFDDVPEENVGSVLALDELAPYPGI
ncbi:hypothetical protein ACF08W_30200 [Streptomyces sp. NPDC015144]|uniref:hypothetical protein n=1 Tax=Streptomyces sp. NPDC015144 TaxID=3364944 RepID=UPI0036FEBB39